MNRKFGPVFIGVGFQRCGTSWLNKVLFEHPDICKPESGLHFFNKNYHAKIIMEKKLSYKTDFYVPSISLARKKLKLKNAINFNHAIKSIIN